MSSELEMMWKEVLVVLYDEVEINFLFEQVRKHKLRKLKIIYVFIYVLILSFFRSFVLSFRSLSYEKFIALSKENSPQSAI